MYDEDVVHPHSPPVSELLGDEQVLEVVVHGPLVLLQERVGVAEAVAGLSLHHLVPQLPGQLQRLPADKGKIPNGEVILQYVHLPLSSTRGQTLPAAVLTCSTLWLC